jgi:hypothetical protein
MLANRSGICIANSETGQPPTDANIKTTMLTSKCSPLHAAGLVGAVAVELIDAAYPEWEAAS